MENPAEIILKPNGTFTFLKTLPSLVIAISLLIPAWHIAPLLIIPAVFAALFSLYRYKYIGGSSYTINPLYISVRRGVFFKQDQLVKIKLLKDYELLQPAWMQWLGLMDLSLHTLDPLKPLLRLRGIPRSDLIEVLNRYVREARDCQEVENCG